ncbi:MAG TPA: transcriptional regulator NrdR [Acidobacteriota bacterium]|nr:transcriptional regulator NrdR [Acidobacteriota bacterium]
MRCPFCGSGEDRVIDSREGRDGRVIRRRRECLKCHRRFTSYERIEDIPFMVVKKGGYREPFNRAKLLTGLLKACEKRPVSNQQLEELAELVEHRMTIAENRELTSEEIGRILMSELKKIDKVAYVRFASVYLDFQDVKDFSQHVDSLAP